MGKIGDLFVRLGLKSDDYKKGMADAKKETQSFSQKLGNMKAGALAVWAAIGASVLSFSKQMIDATNRVGDAWAMFLAEAKAGWSVFLQSLSTQNFDNFISRIKDAVSAAKELQSALDAEFEISNSIKLQKAAMAEELSELEILARNASKPHEERAKAAQKYLDMVKPIYDQELNLANRLLDARQGNWLAGTGLQDNAKTREELQRFLVDYGKNQNLANALAAMVDANSKTLTGSTKLAKAQLNGNKQYVSAYRAAAQYVAEYQKTAGYSNSLFEFAKVYETLRGDKDTQPLIEALINAGVAAGAFNRDTKRMQSALNTSLAQIGGEAGESGMSLSETLAQELNEIENSLYDEVAAIEDIDLEVPEIDTSSLDKYEARLQEFTDNWAAEQQEIAMLNAMLTESIVAAIGGGMEAFTDMLFGIEGADASAILGALMQPFADTAGQLGSMLIAQGLAIEAFKTSLESLNGVAAIAAGTALLAISAAMKSGIKALAKGGASAGSAASYGGGSYGGSMVENYESTLTVNVVGHISGSDIALSLDRTRNKQRR